MPRFAAVSRHHVTSALADQDGEGLREEFVVMHGGQAYGAESVLSLAHQKATGTAVPDHDWTSKDQAARLLRELGFRVLAGDDPDAVVPVTGSWQETSDVGPDATREAWTAAARETLVEAARRYRATVTPKVLAIEVQRRSGIRTKQQMHYWLGEVLGRVALESAALDEPQIVALCVDEAGRVGDGYAVAVLAAYGDRPENPNAHAAKEQLECYRFFEAVGLPADGGSVAPPKVVAAPRARKAATRAPAVKRPTKPADIPLDICPTCFMAKPRSGVCENCA
ncbi:MAG: hypothetical protein ABIO16_16585 [Nocardioides sp.]